MEIGEEGTASMATKNKKLAIEDYLDFVKNRDHQLTCIQLRKIISMHGFRAIDSQKSTLLEAVKTINLMDLRRSTLEDGSVSGGACLTLTSVINDLKDLQWQECHVTSLISQGVAATATSATKDRTIPVNRKKSKGLGKKPVEVEADDYIFSIKGTIDVDSSTTVVKVKRLEDLGKKPVEVAADDSISSSTTVSVKRKISKGLEKKPVDDAADDSTISTKCTTVAAGGTTVSAKSKRLKGLGMGVVAADHPISTTGTTRAAGSPT